ncbi:NCS1 family nucleobase:cation symporter-1 [Salinisphaera sp. T31B1]|uniref:NCS1 family nucleobase:cation symporter-1 n=1 Tax=Salinisphaera sp. T31B1 TaxID=727963 RepID=UPI00333E3A3A
MYSESLAHRRSSTGAAPARVENRRAGPAGVSRRLYNRDLAPTLAAGRQWTAYHVFTVWANDVHSLGNYTFAIGLFALGLGVWQILAAFAIGAAVLFGLLTLSGFMGQKTGVPFPVLSRIAFGIKGAQVAAVVRGGVAIVWFGIQTYLASVVLRGLLLAVFPALARLDGDHVLGLSLLGWCAFAALWAVQVVIVSYGMGMVRRYVSVAGPVILVTMLALAVWVFVRAGASIAWSTGESLTGWPMWREILSAAALWVVIYGTFALNFCDFTRSVADRRSIVLGNLFGIPLNMLFFAVIVVVLAGAQFRIDGRIIESPADIVQTIPDTGLLALAAGALIVLTIAVNLVANFVAPIYMLANLFPRYLNFRRAGLVSALLGVAILPWNLYNSPIVIEYFLGALGCLLGPVFGVLIADYWLVRRACINVPDLYTEAAHGDYHYRHGFNPRAFAAGIPAALISLAVALAPPFAALAGFSWFFGAGLAGLIYTLIADRSQQPRDIDGESIAVASE